MKKHNLLMVLVVVVLFVAFQTVYAKGTNRAVITGTMIDGEIVVDSAEEAVWLSMGTFENVNHGEIEQPLLLGDEYAIERQFINDNTGAITPFDNVLYYPDPDGGFGYVYYIGIVNGGSGYDDNWYRVSVEGESAFQRVVNNADVHPYVVLADGAGRLHILDRFTLETVKIIELGVDLPSTPLVTTANGRLIYYEVDGESYVVNLETVTNCVVETTPTWVLNRPLMLQASELFTEEALNMIAINDDAQILDFNHDFAYLYMPEVNGVLTLNRMTGEVVEQLTLNQQLQAVLMGFYTVYGITTDADGMWLSAYALYDNEVFARAEVSDEVRSLSYVAIDTGVLDDDVVEINGC